MAGFSVLVLGGIFFKSIWDASGSEGLGFWGVRFSITSGIGSSTSGGLVDLFLGRNPGLTSRLSSTGLLVLVNSFGVDSVFPLSGVKERCLSICVPDFHSSSVTVLLPGEVSRLTNSPLLLIGEGSREIFLNFWIPVFHGICSAVAVGDIESISEVRCLDIFFKLSAPVFHGTACSVDNWESLISDLFWDLFFFNSWVPCFFHAISSSFFVAGGKREWRPSDWLLCGHGASTDSPSRGILSVGGELDSRRLLPLDALLQGTCCVPFLLSFTDFSVVSVVILSFVICESSV